MKVKYCILLVIVLLLGLFGCKKEVVDEEVDPDSRYRTYYQLLVYSFADGNGDGIGDFKGIIDKLDYLENLGIQGLWLSPINKASSYHAYDVNNYYAINGRYIVEVDGVTYDFPKLIEECHKRDIHVILDLVLNHTSSNNKWYSEHRNWYSSDNKFGFPELNFDLPEVREAVKEVGYYWLDQGADGFRLDAAMWVYNGGSNQHTKNYEFWTEWTTAMRKHKKDCYIIAEVLDSNSSLFYSYAQGGFDSTFDFKTINSVVRAVKGTSKDYADAVANGIAATHAINENYILARTLSNHDIGRFSDTGSNGHVSQKWEIILGNVINVLTPGNTFIYYGDELGMKGTCPGGWEDMSYRTPMPFQTERTDSNAYFYTFNGDRSTTSVTFSGNTAEEDMNDPNSIYNKLKEATALKNSELVFKKGTIESIDDLNIALSGYSLYLDGRTVYVIFNPTANDITYDFSGDVLLSSQSASGQSVILGQGDYIVIDVK